MDPLQELVANLPPDHPVVALHNGRSRPKAESNVLRNLRHSQNLTQAELADMLYVTQERVSAMERAGVSRAQIDTLRRYVEALGGRLRVVVELGDERIEISGGAARPAAQSVTTLNGRDLRGHEDQNLR
jgi:transcriptional regulator with XRE-family HTH domain